VEHLPAATPVDLDSPPSPCDVDRDLWEVLELCSRDELELLYETLFSPSLFSPFVKSLVTEKEPASIEYRGRTSVMHKIQSRFRFLAASSMETLKGYRPTYRETLMHIQSKFNIRCPRQLETSDLETEIYLYLLSNCQQFISEQPQRNDLVNVFQHGDGMSSPRMRPMGFFNRLLAPLRLGQQELLSMISKLGGALTVSAVKQAVLDKLGMQIVMNNVRYQAALRTAYQHGLNSLKKRIAVQVTQRSVTKAVARYSTVNGTLSLLGPLLWAWLAVDVVLKSIGTDYARIIKTVFSLAQIRLIKTYGFTTPKMAD